MLYEPTTLAASASALAETVQTYGVDPRKLFAKFGLDVDAMQEPGARYPFRSMIRLWAEARNETGDPCIGLIAAQKIRPPALHALGLSWLASPTLLEGLHRIERYAQIVNSVLQFKLTVEGTRAKLARVPIETRLQPTDEAVDASLAVIVKMCRAIADPHFAPMAVTFRHADNGHIEQYIDYFHCPVRFSATEDALYFDSAALRQPAPAGNRELAYHNDRAAERYLATLNPERVRDKVKEILLTLLPSGEATQEAVASSLNKSISTLQRQLKAEGVNYRELLDQTRRELAQQLLEERRYALSQIAYLLGFSDQGNFSRAFKRWTGRSPAAFRRRAETSASGPRAT
jgi:AraC-like DNA-binding protein